MLCDPSLNSNFTSTQHSPLSNVEAPSHSYPGDEAQVGAQRHRARQISVCGPRSWRKRSAWNSEGLGEQVPELLSSLLHLGGGPGVFLSKDAG